jgi:hypothetical protein
MTDSVTLVVLGAVWIGSTAGGGLLLALIARRIHPALPLGRLWLFYSVLLGFLAGTVMFVGLR